MATRQQAEKLTQHINQYCGHHHATGNIIHTGGKYGYHAEVVDETDGRSYPMGGCPEADSHPEHNSELCMGYDERVAARYGD